MKPLALLLLASLSLAATEYGPYHGIFIPDGLGLKKSFGAPNPPIQGSSQFTMSCWVRSEEPYPERTLVAGFGELSTSVTLPISPDQIISAHCRVPSFE